MFARSMMTFAVMAFAGTAFSGTAGAATFDDPDWPCIQRRIDQISLGQVWAGPIPDEAVEELAATPEIQSLATRLELRRTPMEEAEALIAGFAETASEEELTALYLATFNRINRARGAIVGGIGRYARKQAALQDQIEERRAEMAALTATLNDPDPDYDRIDMVEQQLEWDTRIFTDRQQSLIYVCETPVILEQRAFALARAVMAHLP